MTYARAQMDIDYTFVFQGVIIFGIIVFLWTALFSPILEVLDLRERSIAGARADSQKLLHDTKAKETQLETQLEDARRRALGERQKMLGEARDAERKLLDDARNEAMKKIEHARSSLKASEASAKQQIQASGQELGRLLAQKILSRDVS